MQDTSSHDLNNRPIDLRPDILDRVRSILKGYVPGRAVRAYGSRVKWSARDHSDLDLVVMGATFLDALVLATLRDAFEASDLPIRVDVFDWNSIPNFFYREIERDFILLQKESKVRDWSDLSLRDFAPFHYGKSLPAHKRDAQGIVPVYGSNGIVGYHNTPLTDGPTVIIGRKGTVGAVHYSSVPCWPIDTTFFVQETSPQLARFKYYALGALGLSEMNSDSAVPGLNRDSAHDRRILVPTEAEQVAMGVALGALDDKIALNLHKCETLEEMAGAIFRAWFVDFEPVRAKMEGRWNEGESMPGFPAHLYPLFPDRLADSELGPIPVGWHVGLLSDIVKHLKRNRDPANSPESLFGYYSIPSYDKDKMPELVNGSEIKSQKTVVAPGVILLSRLNPDIERVWLVEPEIHEPAVCSTEFAVLRATRPANRSLLYCLARSDRFRSELVMRVTGTSKSHQRVKPDTLLSMNVVISDEPVAEAFEGLVIELLNQATALRKQSASIAVLRETLLPKLISGEVRLPPLI